MRSSVLCLVVAAACTKPGEAPVCSPAASWSDPVLQCAKRARRVTVRGEKLELRETVEFETDSATLHGRSKPLLDEVATEMRHHPEIKKVQIEGHTDSRATREHNQKLSEERAESVKSYLVGKGVSAQRLTTKGFGQDKPIADNKTEEGRFKNRRVDFRIIERK